MTHPLGLVGVELGVGQDVDDVHGAALEGGPRDRRAASWPDDGPAHELAEVRAAPIVRHEPEHPVL